VGAVGGLLHLAQRQAVAVVNYELENGVYVIKNKVLRPGQKFRLVLGKQQAWIALK